MGNYAGTLHKNSATAHMAITPSDTTDNAHFVGVLGGAIHSGSKPMLGLFVGGAGTITALDAAGNTAVYNAVAGSVIPMQFRYILATGTTATGLIGMY